MKNNKKVSCLRSGFEDEFPISSPVACVAAEDNPSAVNFNKNSKLVSRAEAKSTVSTPYTVQMCFYITPELDRDIRMYCAANRLTKTELINRSLSFYLENVSLDIK